VVRRKYKVHRKALIIFGLNDYKKGKKKKPNKDLDEREEKKGRSQQEEEEDRSTFDCIIKMFLREGKEGLNRGVKKT